MTTNLSKNISSDALYAHLTEFENAEIDGWYISLNDDGIWITNPYGQDCGLYKNSAEDCKMILNRISEDAHDQ